MFSLVAPLLLAADPVLVARPDAFQTLVNPNCSHCVDEAKRRPDELKPDDPVLAWTRGYSDGGAIPVRFFLAPYRVISDSYGVFVYDPDAGFARGFAPGYTYRFHGWRNGVMVMKDARDGTLYSCLTGVAFDGPKKGTRLTTVPTLTTTWGDWLKRYPHAVAYHMFDKYQPVELPTAATADSVKSRGTPDPRLKPDDRVYGVFHDGKAKAYPVAGLPQLTLDGGVVVLRSGDTVAAYRPMATQPRKFTGPAPDKDGVSPPNPGVPVPPGTPEKPDVAVELSAHGNAVTSPGGNEWDVAGRCTVGPLKGWALVPADGVACKWFAWAAEYPDTAVYAPPADVKKAVKMVAGTAEFLRVLPKPFGTVKAIDPAARTVTLLLDGEAEAKVWPVEPDAEVKVAGWWGRLEQFAPGQRVWAWLKLNRDKKPVAVAMLCDAATEWDMHASLRDGATPPAAADLEAKRAAQRAWLRARWERDGLPGTLTFHHVFSGELELMLDHEAMRWGRNLSPGDAVTVRADPPIKGVVKAVAPWRERTQVRVVVGELASADLKIGQRLNLSVPALSKAADESAYPPDLGRPRARADRVEWFVCSTYCVCGVGPDICTGMFYTLASCNPNGCGAPNALREEVGGMIDAGKSDKAIWDALAAGRGPLMAKPHLRP